MIKSDGLGVTSAIPVAVIWGLSFVAARMVLSTLSPVILATVRFIIASLIFIPLLVRECRQGFALQGRDIIELALLVVGLIPILTGIASTIFLKESLSFQKVLGTTLGIVGVGLVTLPGFFLVR